jgi:TPR repeat protein
MRAVWSEVSRVRLFCGIVFALLSACTQQFVPPSTGNASLRVPDESLPLLKAQAERGDVRAALKLADYYGLYLDNRQKDNRERQVHYYNVAATHGSIVAINNLIRTYSVDSDYFSISKALYWRDQLKAASRREKVLVQSDAEWYYDLYLEFFVGEHDKKRGLSFLRSAAELGSIKAQRELVEIYTTDPGFRDPLKAQHWRRRLQRNVR